MKFLEQVEAVWKADEPRMAYRRIDIAGIVIFLFLLMIYGYAIPFLAVLFAFFFGWQVGVYGIVRGIQKSLEGQEKEDV